MSSWNSVSDGYSSLMLSRTSRAAVVGCVTSAAAHAVGESFFCTNRSQRGDGRAERLHVF